MKLQITLLWSVIAFLLATSMLLIAPVMTQAAEHEHEHEHSEEAVATHTDIEQMQALIALLTQLLEVMQQQAALNMGDHHEHGDSHVHDTVAVDNGLTSINVELHGDQTHVHVNYSDGDQDMFFVAADIADKESVYDAIVLETDLDRDLVVDMAKFENDEAHEHNHSESTDGSHVGMDLTGIHIMADGSVMLGDGTTLADATVNDEDMIVLSDGTEVEPLMDMR